MADRQVLHPRTQRARAPANSRAPDDAVLERDVRDLRGQVRGDVVRERLRAALGDRKAEQVGQQRGAPHRGRRVAHPFDGPMCRPGPRAHPPQQVEGVRQIVRRETRVALPRGPRRDLVPHQRDAIGGQQLRSPRPSRHHGGEQPIDGHRVPVVAAGDLAALAGERDPQWRSVGTVWEPRAVGRSGGAAAVSATSRAAVAGSLKTLPCGSAGSSSCGTPARAHSSRAIDWSALSGWPPVTARTSRPDRNAAARMTRGRARRRGKRGSAGPASPPGPCGPSRASPRPPGRRRPRPEHRGH